MYHEIDATAYYPESFQAWAARIVRRHASEHPYQKIIKAFIVDHPCRKGGADQVHLKIYTESQSEPVVYRIIKSRDHRPHTLLEPKHIETEGGKGKGVGMGKTQHFNSLRRKNWLKQSVKRTTVV